MNAKIESRKNQEVKSDGSRSYFAVFEGKVVDNFILGLFFNGLRLHFLHIVMITGMVLMLFVFFIIESQSLLLWMLQIHRFRLFFLTHFIHSLIDHCLERCVLWQTLFFLSSPHQLYVLGVLHLQELSWSARVILGDHRPSYTEPLKALEDDFNFRFGQGKVFTSSNLLYRVNVLLLCVSW